MKSQYFDNTNTDELGQLKDDRRRQKKSKKQNEKQLLNEYYSEIEKEKEKFLPKQRKLYENMQIFISQ